VLWVWVVWVLGLTIATAVGTILVRYSRDRYGLPALVSIYIAYLMTANVIASRVSEFHIVIAMILPGGVITYPFVAQAIDMINEIYGRRTAYVAILLALTANVILTLFVLMLATVPPAPWLSDLEEAWRFFFLQTPRIIIASYIAFFTAELLDATIFSEIKRRLYRYEVNVKIMTVGALTRSLSTDVVNMVVDTIVFYPLAFYGVIPTEALIPMIIHGSLTKALITALDTPWFIAFRLLTRNVKRDF
jgi:uncharacterized integral membrane protein (TIGR00697 family)